MIKTFNQHRPLLFGIAYRMSGSVAAAEDLVQETWLRWQKQDPADIRSPKAWLVAAITRLCIDQARSARHAREEYYGVWLPEPLVEASPRSAPDERAAQADSLTMAFMLLLETLSATERAVFLLREVFDYDYADIAAIVGKSEANCRQIVRRAKAQLTAQPAPAAPPGELARHVVERFVEATATGRVEDLLAVLTADASLYSDGGGKATAAKRPLHSARHISRLFVGVLPRRPANTILHYTQINSRPGVLMSAQGRIYSAISFEVQADRVQTIYVVRNPEKLRHLNQPTLN